MTPEQNLQLLWRVVRACESIDDFEGMHFGSADDGSVYPWVNIGDVFAWACADSQDISPDTILQFEQAVADVESVDCHDDYSRDIQDRLQHMNYNKCADAGVLFACRVRGQKPFKHEGRYPVHQSVEPLIEALPGTDNTRCGVPKPEEGT